jgi:hypothetical protein
MAPTAACEVHPSGRHTPASLEAQDHHVIPRHWQQLWAPAAAPYPGTFSEFGVTQTLWDARTVKVPPTCHRNVHGRLVQLMHVLDEMRHLTASPLDVNAAAVIVSKRAGRLTTMANQEIRCAMLAPLRFIEAGGQIGLLLDGKAWGQA